MRSEGLRRMLAEEIKKLKKEIKELKALLREREEALPAHSVRPHQMQGILDLEDEIAEKEAELRRARDSDLSKIE